MGAGHDTVAAELARRAREAGHRAHVADVLQLLPYGLGSALHDFYRASVRHFPWAYGGLYRAFLRRGTGNRPSGVPLARLAADALTEIADRTGADVVVPVFHLAAQLTGHLRERGRLTVPSVVFVIDFAVHRQWLHAGNDHYVCLTEDAARVVRQDLGVPADVTGPLVAPGFLRPARGAPRWRELFDGRAPGRTAVLLSSGAWGAASRPVETARLLAEHGGFLPVALCGRNERLRRRLSTVPGVLAPAWVEDMPGLMAAAGALVDNAAGQTAVQALAAGLPVVAYRPLPGHGAEGVAAMAALGLTRPARDTAGLLSVLHRLTAPGPDRDRAVARGHAAFRDDDAVLRVVEQAARAARATG
ncbi:galactosyldiacylglycerol synthase [Streptomyces actuosus]|uniref:Galactosyldiacylglycerol synthase n=1 Tax=Streptomyces actuosus TaxID=1885 RepID=A0ABS2VIC5_STRAS|nr:galactosyldiacylglycerol synthase [Streptomyces actuosus]MBN0042844.1 galactosyldiacylglycerol synthase [Streptomyces actuosus]